jgi:hypothetical protein
MTLVVSMLNSEYAVQLSDRRLSTPRATVTDEANKAIVVITLTGRVVMGYSGLAQAGNRDIFETIKDVLLEAATPDYAWERMVYRFAGGLSEVFNHPTIRALPPGQRRASFHFVGHMRTYPPTPTITYVSNWNDPGNWLRADSAAHARETENRKSASPTRWERGAGRGWEPVTGCGLGPPALPPWVSPYSVRRRTGSRSASR